MAMAGFSPTALLLVLFFFSPLALEAATSALISSIDCGASKPYTDDLGIKWTPDSSLIEAGQPQTVPGDTSVPKPMQTLRVFPTGKRNCYALSIPGGATQVLVRATFFYGNYDGKNSPPTFNLELDGNGWSTVETSVNTAIIAELIYEARGGSTSVCVVRTNDGELPFVSAIEVRRIGDDMYSAYDRRSSALFLTQRMAVGLAAEVRYPDDPYDRIWFPFNAPNSVDVAQNQATAIDISGITDAPPAAIFQAAVTPTAGSNMISFTTLLPSDNVAAYFNMYFTEVTQLAASGSRTFQIVVDDNAVSDPFAPPFGSGIEFYMANFSASSSTLISLQPTADATLPPVISAIEVYMIIPLSGGGGGGENETPALGTTDAPPSDLPSANDDSSSSSSVSGQTNSPTTAERVPTGFAAGGGRKGIPSSGNKENIGRALGIGVGILAPILFLNFV